MSATAKKELIKLCLQNDILRFGEFKLKSGRASPYFFNAGLFNRGKLLAQLADHYAKLIAKQISGEFMIYGPAYKGITLAAVAAVKLCDYNLDIPYAFHRKEEKSYGEGGNLVGAELRGRVVILDDVITAGTAIDEAITLIRAAGATPDAVVIILDRMEISDGGDRYSAVQQVVDKYNIKVHSLLTLNDLINFIETTPAYEKYAEKVKTYRQTYGAS